MNGLEIGDGYDAQNNHVVIIRNPSDEPASLKMRDFMIRGAWSADHEKLIEPRATYSVTVETIMRAGCPDEERVTFRRIH